MHCLPHQVMRIVTCLKPALQVVVIWRRRPPALAVMMKVMRGEVKVMRKPARSLIVILPYVSRRPPPKRFRHQLAGLRVLAPRLAPTALRSPRCLTLSGKWHHMCCRRPSRRSHHWQPSRHFNLPPSHPNRFACQTRPFHHRHRVHTTSRLVHHARLGQRRARALCRRLHRQRRLVLKSGGV